MVNKKLLLSLRSDLNKDDLVAQSVEQRPFKPWVLGSSPSQITRSP